MSVTTVVGTPSTRARPLVGHGIRLQRKPLEFLAELHRLSEPIVRIRLGRKDAYVVTAPELLDPLLRGKIAHSVEKGAFFDAMRAVLGDGIVVSSEPKHMRHRRLMAPGFHRGQVASYIDIMADSAAKMVEGWRPGQRIELDQELGALSLRIVARSLFSSDIAEEVVTESLRVFPVVAAEMPKRAMLPWLARLPLRNRTFDAGVRRLVEVIDRIIAEYRTQGQDHRDIVSMLLAARFDDGSGLGDREIRDEVMTMYAAGYETVSNAVTCAFHELGRRPDIREQLEREARDVLGDGPVTADNIHDLVYTEKVVTETLRRYCPVWLGMRETTADIELGGVAIASGTTIIYSPYTLHNDPKYYTDPAIFDPDRWTPEYRKTMTRSGAFQPFGIGNRNCIGEPFAWLEAKTVLATVAARARLEPVAGVTVRQIAAATVQLDRLPMIVCPPVRDEQPRAGV
ncbi:cytochrome P450 [Nocardia paucivorans]|uniref:cytochrome P450 n=1 Tax=Nocardia paucivorans TaxID=114259 RepID=UPI0012F9706D|nr:cytochrome P450 [Nocardia paucivorans]